MKAILMNVQHPVQLILECVTMLNLQDLNACVSHVILINNECENNSLG